MFLIVYYVINKGDDLMGEEMLELARKLIDKTKAKINEKELIDLIREELNSSSGS